jgi:hypothetical protein
LLVIGYSGNDREVLNLLRESATSVQSLTVVNHDHDAAVATKRTLHSEAGIPEGPGEPHDGDLDGYMQGPGFDHYVEWLSTALP